MFALDFIVPTWHYFADPFKLQPLNELYLATVLDDHFQGQVDVGVTDLRELRRTGLEPTDENIQHYVPERDLYLYWITKSADFLEVTSVVRALKGLYPSARHIAGGTHIEFFPEDSSPHFDAIVIGPGEESLKLVVTDFDTRSLQERYVDDWRNADYATYPYPRRDFLPEKGVVNTELFAQYGNVPGTSAMFSRGCNFRCAYCVYNIPRFIQSRKPEQISNEIGYLKKEYKVEGVNLRDEICLPLAKQTAIPYIEAIARQNVIWRGQTRVGADEEVVRLAAQAGLVELAVGVESASQKVLDIINKKQTVDAARDFIIMCRSYGIKIKMCLILGLPGEPADIVDKTMALIEAAQPDFVNVSGFCPVPGSEVFERANDFGIRYIDRDWRKHAHLVYRFTDDESFGLPFEYHEYGPWGPNFSRSEIVSNIQILQKKLRYHGMVY